MVSKYGGRVSGFCINKSPCCSEIDLFNASDVNPFPQKLAMLWKTTFIYTFSNIPNVGAQKS